MAMASFVFFVGGVGVKTTWLWIVEAVASNGDESHAVVEVVWKWARKREVKGGVGCIGDGELAKLVDLQVQSMYNVGIN